MECYPLFPNTLSFDSNFGVCVEFYPHSPPKHPLLSMQGLVSPHLGGSALSFISGRQRFASPKYDLWDIDFSLVIRNRKTQKEILTLPLHLNKRIDRKPA